MPVANQSHRDPEASMPANLNHVSIGEQHCNESENSMIHAGICPVILFYYHGDVKSIDLSSISKEFFNFRQHCGHASLCCGAIQGLAQPENPQKPESGRSGTLAYTSISPEIT
jgi:hypothetical protein